MSGLLSVECRRAPDGAQGPAPEAEARWIVDPKAPGPSLPPVGRSLFDHLLARAEGREVPFPFRALTDALEAELQATSPGSGLRSVLIPRGRSLQRDAAGPEFFKYPRAVVAVDTGPAVRAGTSGMLLKDRLYLGYHETAAVIEVISYNEAAGRFEFQVVKDYRPGGARRLAYANRDLCMACHQNGGPIFARPLWDETNGNPDIASRLRAEQRDFYGIPVDPGVDIAYEVDNATDRANRIAGYQLLWREGCGRAGPASVTCRADLFVLALQQRLSGGSTLDRASGRYGRTVRERLARRWRTEWPQGLRLPNPDIPNRVPLRPGPFESRGPARASTTLTPAVQGRLAELVRQTDIPSALEPLSPRDPLEVWTAGAGESGLPDRLVMGLGGFLADADVRRLDDRLAAQASTTPSRFTSACAIATAPRDGGTTRLSFTCSAPSGPTAGETAGGFSMTGRLYLQGSRVLRGTIDSLAFGGIPETPTLAVERGTVSGQATQRRATVTLRQQSAGGRARRANGHRVESVTLHFPAAGRPATTGAAVLVTVDDFAVVEKAVDEMAAATGTDVLDALADKPFRRASLLRALDTRLGAAPLSWCCLDDEGMPAPVLEQDEREDARPQDAPTDSRLQALQRYCGRCHETDERFPPNFLHGSEADVSARVAQCAERIFFRLGMWERPADVRPKAPMPPLSALAILNVSHEEWPDHPDLKLLDGYVAGILSAQQGRPPEIGELEARGYANLRPCLAPGGARGGGK